jgi:hypothetical protein
MNIKIKKLKAHNQYKVEMTLTAGAILALRNALANYPSSPVASDVLDFLDAAVNQDAELKESIKE